MKKIIFFILSVVFASMLMVSGCSQQTSNPAATATSSLDKQEKIGEIEFSVPSEWSSIEKEDDSGTYYYPYEEKATLLGVQFFSTSEFESYDILDKDEMTEIFDAYISGIKESSENYYELSKDVNVLSDGTYYVMVNFNSNINESDYEVLACVFFTPTHVYSLMFAQPSEISDSFRDIYNEIIKSIVIISNEEATAESTEKPANTEQKEDDTAGVATDESNKNGSATQATTAKKASSVTQATTAKENSSPTPTPIKAISDSQSVTIGEQNALKKAKSYLAYSAFSREGLIDQLEYEGFTNKESVYGVDNCGANWNEQALKKAKSYLDYSSFSRSGLISQLEYEGFTHDQAVYGADSVGL